MARKMLTREQILKKDDLQTEWVKVPEWGKGAEVLVSSWTARVRDRFDLMLHAAGAKGDNERDVRAMVVSLSVVDPDTREPLFDEADVAQLSRKNQAPMNRLFAVASRLNPLTDTAIEDAAKN